MRSSKDLLCLTSHLSSSKSPFIPPSFLIDLVKVATKHNSKIPDTMYLALFNPVAYLMHS